MVLGGVALGIIACFIPPLPVLWRAGCGSYFLISIVLMFLGWIPAVVFAWFVIIEKPNLRQKRANRNKAREGDTTEYGRRSFDSGRSSGRPSSVRFNDRPVYEERRWENRLDAPPAAVREGRKSGSEFGYGGRSAAVVQKPPPYEADPYYGQQTGYAPAPSRKSYH